MFGPYHFIWIAICLVLIVVGVLLIKKYKPSFNVVLNIACIFAILSEVTKVFSSIEFATLSNGNITPYLSVHHVPFHLCSIQIIFIFFVRFAKEGKIKNAILAFMYPTCLIGAFLAIVSGTTLVSDAGFSEAFLRPMTYQYFIYHAMLVILGIYILMNRDIKIENYHYLTSLGMLMTYAFVCVYLNSIFARTYYFIDEAGQLIADLETTNFLYIFRPPFDFIKLTQPWHWWLYFGIIILLAVVLITLFYIPIFVRNKKEQVHN